MKLSIPISCKFLPVSILLLSMSTSLYAQTPGVELPKFAEKIEWQKIGDVDKGTVSYDVNSRLEHENLVFSRFQVLYTLPQTIALAAVTYDEEWRSYQFDCKRGLYATTGAAKLNKGTVIQDFDIRKMTGMVVMPKMRPIVMSGVEGLAFHKTCSDQ